MSTVSSDWFLAYVLSIDYKNFLDDKVQIRRFLRQSVIFLTCNVFLSVARWYKTSNSGAGGVERSITTALRYVVGGGLIDHQCQRGRSRYRARSDGRR